MKFIKVTPYVGDFTMVVNADHIEMITYAGIANTRIWFSWQLPSGKPLEVVETPEELLKLIKECK